MVMCFNEMPDQVGHNEVPCWGKGHPQGERPFSKGKFPFLRPWSQWGNAIPLFETPKPRGVTSGLYDAIFDVFSLA